MAGRKTSPILIAGPTASGKSALAVALAEQYDGLVINADSMQVYRELRLLTARPSPEDEAEAPHALYGHVGAAEPYSVARWLADVEATLAMARTEKLRPIIVGGTGLYFKALIEGLSPIPDIPEAVRQRWRLAARQAPPGGLHKFLASRDPVMAQRLAPGDTQRVVRALEVLDATGKSLAEWQAVPGKPLVEASQAKCVVIRPPRAELCARAEQRFDRMMAGGALDEVRALLALKLADDMPAMRSLGVQQLAAHLGGRLPLDAAVEQAKLETRQYIKRQETWFDRNMSSWMTINTTINCEISITIRHFIDC